MGIAFRQLSTGKDFLGKYDRNWMDWRDWAKEAGDSFKPLAVSDAINAAEGAPSPWFKSVLTVAPFLGVGVTSRSKDLEKRNPIVWKTPYVDRPKEKRK
jgi:hypothetical protein